jgi:hypothetical protein
MSAAIACSRSVEKTGPEPAGNEQPASTYGAGLSGTSPKVTLDQILEQPHGFAGKTVTVAGKVRRACSRRGCWMELASTLDDSSPGCRVTFKDYGFFVPTDSSGAAATVEGAVQVKQVPRSRVAHLEAEGAKLPNKNADGSATEVQLVATGVELVR